jgi:hypothetical protein
VKVVGAHWFVLSLVRGGDAAARRRSVIDGNASVVLVGDGVVLEHWRGKESKARVSDQRKTEGGLSSP